MNKILLAINLVLIAAVVYLFFKIGKTDSAIKNTAKKLDVPTSSAKDLDDKNGDGKVRIAFYNIDSMNAKSKMMKAMQNELQAAENNAIQSLKSIEAKYKNKVTYFQQNETALTNAEKETMIKEIQTLEIQYANAQKAQSEKLGKNESEKFKKMFDTAQEYIKQYCTKNNIDYILGYQYGVSFMIYANPDFDVTADVIKGVDELYFSAKK